MLKPILAGKVPEPTIGATSSTHTPPAVVTALTTAVKKTPPELPT